MDLGRNRRLAKQLVESAFELLNDHPSLLDLKIASAALEEMREAFKMFAPFRDIPKVTIFGSARTQMADPLYMHARDVATRLAVTAERRERPAVGQEIGGRGAAPPDDLGVEQGGFQRDPGPARHPGHFELLLWRQYYTG